jgi:hypothetical protein
METAAVLLFFAFAFLVILSMLVSWIWLMVVAFKTHPGWGFAVLLAHPWGGLVFAISNWQRAKWPALLTVAGFIGIVVLAVTIPLMKSAGLGN